MQIKSQAAESKETMVSGHFICRSRDRDVSASFKFEENPCLRYSALVHDSKFGREERLYLAHKIAIKPAEKPYCKTRDCLVLVRND